MSRHGHGLPWGATWLGNGRTEIRWFAPAQTGPSVIIDDGAPLALTAEGNGFWALTVSAVPGQRYQFVLDDGTRVPDPVSRGQGEDIHGPSLIVDPYAFEWTADGWRGRPWTQSVLYELHVGTCGGFAGVAAELPRLAQLGITTIELMPVADFPGQRNWGYDGVLPYAPDRSYGTPEDFKRLIDRAHHLELAVMLDVVYNHFGPDGNYLPSYAPGFFRNDIDTPWGAAIDFRRPEVRDFFIHNAQYWIHEYRIDGLRFDAVHAIHDPTFLNELADRIRASVPPDRHVHLVLENEHNHAMLFERDTTTGAARRFDAQWNDDFHNTVHVLLTGETEGYYQNYAERPIDHLARSLSEGFVYQGEPVPAQPGRSRGTPSGHLPPPAFVNFLQNHDQVGNRAMGERLLTLCPEGALRAGTLMHLLSPAIPLLFMGEEWGATTPFFFFTDHHDALADQVREGRRKEFAHFTAFADERARARIPDPNAAATFQESTPRWNQADPHVRDEWSTYYRHLLDIRRERLAPRLDSMQAGSAMVLGERAVSCRWTLDTERTWTLVVNLGDEALEVDAPSGELVAQSGAAFAELRRGRLLPHYGCVLVQRTSDAQSG